MRFKSILVVGTAVSFLMTSAPSQATDLRSVFGAIQNQVQNAAAQQQREQREQPRRERDYRDQDQGSSSGSNLAGAAGCGLGALLGSSLVKNRGGKIALGALFCGIGFKLGKELTKKDNAALVTHSNELLERPGRSQETWTAPESGKQVSISTGDAQETQHAVTFAVDSDVAAPEAGTKIVAATYVVTSQTLNFRRTPSVEADNVIGFFSKGENVEVIGRTPDGQWALVGDEGVVVGYAAFKQGGKDLLVTPAAAAAARAAPRTSMRARPKIRQATSSGPADFQVRVREDASVKAVKVVASTQCKAVVATIGKNSDTQTGCAQPDGKWAMG